MYQLNNPGSPIALSHWQYFVLIVLIANYAQYLWLLWHVCIILQLAMYMWQGYVHSICRHILSVCEARWPFLCQGIFHSTPIQVLFCMWFRVPLHETQGSSGCVHVFVCVCVRVYVCVHTWVIYYRNGNKKAIIYCSSAIHSDTHSFGCLLTHMHACAHKELESLLLKSN